MSSGTYNCDVHCPNCGGAMAVEVEWYYDPGVRTFPNGDPGYPPTEETNLFLVVDKKTEDFPESCVLCGHKFLDSEIEEIWDEAEEKQPAEEPDYEAETRHMGPDQ